MVQVITSAELFIFDIENGTCTHTFNEYTYTNAHNLKYTKFTFILLQFSIYFFITPTFFRVSFFFFCSSHVIWKIAYFTCPCIFVCLEIYKNIIKIRHLSKSLQLFVRRRAESISFHMIFVFFLF